MLSNILIIGPDQSKKGGVATHINNITNYEALKDAEIIDVGSRGTTLKSGRSSYWNIFKSLLSLRKIIKNDRFHVLINASIYKSSFIKLLLILLVIDEKHTKDLFVFFHGGRFDSKFEGLGRLSWLYTRILNKPDKFFFLSEVQKKGFLKRIGDYPVSIYNNYSSSDEGLSRKEGEGIFTFLFVGRVVREKGIYELIEAVKLLQETGYNNFHLAIVGDGSNLREIKKKIKANKLGEIISLYGFLGGDKLNRMYMESNWLVLPTYHEGFPYVFIESMRAGLPMITTRSGALTRLVTENVNGLFVEAKDVNSLYKKMKFVLDEKLNLSDNCYSFFSKNLSKSAGESFYKDLIS